MNPRIWLSGRAPTKPSTGWPLSKAITAGIDWMPSCPAICGCSSMFILTSATFPPASATARSSAGASCLHGPHHGAQKSTSTGCCWEAVRHVRPERGRGHLLDRARRLRQGRRSAVRIRHRFRSPAQPGGKGPAIDVFAALNGGAARVIQPASPPARAPRSAARARSRAGISQDRRWRARLSGY